MSRITIPVLKQRRTFFEQQMETCPGKFVTLGERLRQIRKAVGVTAEPMAEILLVSESTLRNWESDRASPSWYYLLLISKMFGISLDTMFYGVGPTSNQVTGERKDTVAIKILPSNKKPKTIREEIDPRDAELASRVL